VKQEPNNLQGGDIAFLDYNQAVKMGEVDSVRRRLSRRSGGDISVVFQATARCPAV